MHYGQKWWPEREERREVKRRELEESWPHAATLICAFPSWVRKTKRRHQVAGLKTLSYICRSRCFWPCWRSGQTFVSKLNFWTFSVARQKQMAFANPLLVPSSANRRLQNARHQLLARFFSVFSTNKNKGGGKSSFGACCIF